VKDGERKVVVDLVGDFLLQARHEMIYEFPLFVFIRGGPVAAEVMPIYSGKKPGKWTRRRRGYFGYFLGYIREGRAFMQLVIPV